MTRRTGLLGNGSSAAWAVTVHALVSTHADRAHPIVRISFSSGSSGMSCNRQARSSPGSRWSAHAPRGEPGCQAERVLHGTGVGLALADDIVGGAMGRRREHRLETGGHGDALAEAEQLGGDLSLVVIHDHHSVEF